MISEPWHSMCLEWRCCHERLARSRSHRRRRLPGKIAVPAGKRTDLSLVPSHLRRCCPPASGGGPADARGLAEGNRSEEHTSELQSLMRLSYAVFCLKKKKQ